jgi:hypothetical protein
LISIFIFNKRKLLEEIKLEDEKNRKKVNKELGFEENVFNFQSFSQIRNSKGLSIFSGVENQAIKAGK